MKAFTCRCVSLATLLLSCVCCCHCHDGGDHAHDPSGKVTHDYLEEVLHILNISSQEFNVDHLQELCNHFTEHFSCGADNKELNINISVLYDSTAGFDNGMFERFFTYLLAVAMEATSTDATCNVTLTNTTAESYSEHLLQRLNATNNTGISVLHLQEVLEALPITEDDHDHEEEDHTDEDHADEDHADEDHADEDDHDHSHTELLFEAECLGADVLFDLLGYDVETDVQSSQLGHLAAFTVLNIIEGAHIARHCRLLPRSEFFLHDIYERLGVNGTTLGEEDVEKIMGTLEIGTVVAEVEVEDEHAGHDHRRKRSTDDDDLLHKHEWEESCYDVHQIFAIYDVDSDHVTMDTFSKICPAFIQQKMSDACIPTAEQTTSTSDTKPSVVKRYGYGILACICVCMSSVAGVVLVMCSSEKAYDNTLAVFLGLAVGTLIADTLLHLIPLALGVHVPHGDGHDHGDGITIEPYIWYAVTACGGTYAFYMIEKIAALVSPQSHTHSHQPYDTHTTTTAGSISTSAIDLQIKQKACAASSYESTTSMVSLDVDETSLESADTRHKGVETIVVMVIIGDSIHNFIDGLVMGAAFSTSITLGVSTTITIFCHELPHELGDVAILLSTGVSFKKALLMNFVSSLTAIVGLFIGLAVAQNDEVQRYIIAGTAGLFLYIALVDILPRLIHSKKSSMVLFLLNNVGMLVGFAFMLLLSIFEGQITY